MADGFTAQVRIQACFDHLYDQAGLMVRIDDRRWVKTGIEFSDGYGLLGSVLTNNTSDWATGQYTGNPSDFWMRVTVQDGVQPLELTGTEFRLLEVLVRQAGQLISKQEISKRAFGKPLTAFDRRIDVHISSVRQKLGLREDGQSWIQSVRGQGYQLLVD